MNLQPLDLLVDLRLRLVSSVGTTMIVRRSAGTPSRSSSPGRSIAPTCWVIARFTTATATSDAGIEPDNRQQTKSIQPPIPTCATREQARAARTSAVTIAIMPT